MSPPNENVNSDKTSPSNDTVKKTESNETKVSKPNSPNKPESHSFFTSGDGLKCSKCGCVHLEKWVSGTCPCLNDAYHMPLIHIPERPSPRMLVRNREPRVSVTPGWEHYVHRRLESTDVYESIRMSSIRSDDVNPMDRPQKLFPTGSSYVGQWNILGMKGHGTYIMPHGVEYCGEFEDGQFHGNGTLTYPNGIKMDCIHDRGKMITWNLKFDDALDYKVPWDYCKAPDRRYYPEKIDNLSPAGRSYITPDKPPREIPPGCYDTGDGFFDPKMKCIYSAIKPSKILRVATKSEEQWILENCRHQWDEPTNYRPDLFSYLVTGADEYSLERNQSTQTIESGSENNDEFHQTYMIAELMDLPVIYSEVSNRQYGDNYPDTFLIDEMNTEPAIKTFGQQSFAKTGQSAIMSQIKKSKSGTISLKVRQGMQTEAGSQTLVTAQSTTKRSGSYHLVTSVKSRVSNGPSRTILSGEADVSTCNGVRVDITDLEYEERISESMVKVDEMANRHSIIAENDSNTKKRISVMTKTGQIDVELSSQSNTARRESGASMRVAKYGENNHPRRAQMTIDAFITPECSIATAQMDVENDQLTTLLKTKCKRSTCDSNNVDISVRSVSVFEPPPRRVYQTEVEEPLLVETSFNATTNPGDNNIKILASSKHRDTISSVFTLDVPDLMNKDSVSGYDAMSKETFEASETPTPKSILSAQSSATGAYIT